MLNDADVEDLMGIEFSRSLRQLANLCRNIICKQNFKEEFIDRVSHVATVSMVLMVSNHLEITESLPKDSLAIMLAVAVVMFVLKEGREKFCLSLLGKLIHCNLRQKSFRSINLP